MKPAPPVIRTRILVVSRDDENVKGLTALAGKIRPETAWRPPGVYAMIIRDAMTRSATRRQRSSPALIAFHFSDIPPSPIERLAGCNAELTNFH
jgi:hypothetical protein